MNTNNRSCGDCTACCEGYLPGQAGVHSFYPGRKCFYLSDGVGCSIYKDRPEDPCKLYKCEWLNDNKNIPEWLKPNLSKVIITKRIIGNMEYFDMIEAGQKMDSNILSWFFFKYIDGTFPNICYKISGGSNYFGSKDFIERMNTKNLIEPSDNYPVVSRNNNEHVLVQGSKK